MNPYLFYVGFSFYLIAGIFYLLQVIFSQTKFAKWGFSLTLLAWILQTLLLVIYFVRVGYPFLVDPFVSYGFSAWVIALIFLLLNLKQRLQLVGALALPTIAVFYLLALFSTENYSSRSAVMQSPWASIHLIFSFLALAVFSLTFVLGIMFIIEEFQLKHKVLPKIFLKLPSLQFLDQIHARALTVGFILLTGGIITGGGWAKSVTGYYFFEDARQLWAICAWLIYLLFLQSRFTAGWRGRRGVLLSLLGFAVIMFTFLGVEHG